MKVLDFGLAKAYEPTPAALDGATVTTPLTHDSTVIGTAAFMSPEQARGLPVDKRTDIWSFGCVLFEMLTGRAAFDGETNSDIISAVLQLEPDWSALPQSTPAGVTRLLKRCLEKEPRRRLRDAGDLRAELEEHLRMGPIASVPGASAPRSRRGYAIAAAAAIGLVALIAAIVVQTGRDVESPPQEILRSTLVLPPDHRLDWGGGAYPLALSPDGMHVVYGGVSGHVTHLYVRDLRHFESKLLPGTDGAQHPFFSPDGRSIAYFAKGGLHRIPLEGGAPLRICAVEQDPRGGTWGAGDTIVFAATGTTLSAVPARGGIPRAIPDSEDANWPHMLPDGRTVLFTIRLGAIATVSLDGGRKRVIGHTANFPGEGHVLAGDGGIMQARYLSTRHLVYGQGFRVMGVTFDVTTSEIKGTPVGLVEPVFRGQGQGGVYFAISPIGALVYAPESNRYELLWIGRDGRATPIGAAPRAFSYARVSPDGTRVAAIVHNENRRQEIWLVDTGRGTAAPYIRDVPSIMPVWAPDGRYLAFHRDGTIARQSADGGPVDVLFANSRAYPTDWAPNGRALLFNQLSAAGADLWELDVRTKAARALMTGASNQRFGRFSPDGRWIAYMEDVSGRPEITVIRYPELTEKVTVSTNGGLFPVWSPDGRELFYRSETAVMAVPVSMHPKFSAGVARVVFDGPYIGAAADRTFDIGRDGRFLMIKGDNAGLGRQLNIVTNWFEELKRLVPPR